MSVPVWGTTLSGPLPVVGLVSFYLTNYLMGRSPLPQPRKFIDSLLITVKLCGISSSFPELSPAEGQVSYVLRTRSPLSVLLHPVRLACIRHAASVHPEPGSNSPSIGSAFRLTITFTHREGDGVLYHDDRSHRPASLPAVLAFLSRSRLLRCRKPQRRQKTASVFATGLR